MKDIQEIIKKVADRYDVEYDQNSLVPKVRYEDGNIRNLDITEIQKIFSKSILEDNNWHQISSLKSSQIKRNRMELQEDKYEYSFEELTVMAY